ncbi:MAG: glycoside hydrolase family 15 protein [Clostridia bacterium]
MKKKYYNDALVGNEEMVVSFSSKGELLRLFYPTRDCRQFVDTLYTGVKINDSNLIYLHEDRNHIYEQYYSENTNVLHTYIENTYFQLQMLQTDFMSIQQNVLIKKYTFTNRNTIPLDVHFLVYSKLLSSFNNMVGTKIQRNIFMQYSHNYTYAMFSKLPLESYRLNNSQEEIQSGILQDKDYIGMANDSAFSLHVGNIEPGETKEFEVFIYINNNREKYRFDEIIEDIEKIRNINTNQELEKTKKYWRKYVKEHDSLGLLEESKEEWWKQVLGKNKQEKENKPQENRENQELASLSIPEGENAYYQVRKIYSRSILLFPLLFNSKTGGISAALEVDEEKDKSGRYSYCWPRDAVFTAKALDILKMTQETEKFYQIFSKGTQKENGMWEQRFYTDGRLAPCWGYQIDETASIIFGIYVHYYNSKNIAFLKDTLEMCQKAIEFLKKYIDYITKQCDENRMQEVEKENFAKFESYDLWEMHQGIHLYSLSAIYAAFTSMIQIYEELKKGEQKQKQKEKKVKEKEKGKIGNIENVENEIKELAKYAEKTKQYCLENLTDKETNTLKRSNKDDIVDISILGAVNPFRMLNPQEKIVQNTIEKIDMTLRTYTGGYLRFERDSYIGGKNPWPIATLWKILYDLQIGETKKARQSLDFITNTTTNHGYLAEQIDNESKTSKWVIGLGWSHALYVIVLYSIALRNGMKNLGPGSDKKFGAC